MSLKLVLLAATALTVLAGPVAAQTAPAPSRPRPTPAPDQPAPEAPQDDQTKVEDVTVTARTSDTRTSIDSVSYSLANDLQATTGSLADALRNVPSVDVDPQGNVSLRGDGNVTILVDGRPSAIFSGPSRGDVILQLPADRYARIEVMTNPSAAYSPEGSGGVINLITKPTPQGAGPQPGQTPTATRTASLRGNVGDNGRWNVGAGGTWQRGDLTLTGDLNYRYDEQPFQLARERDQLDAATQTLVSTTTIDLDSLSRSKGVFGRASAEYALTPRTQLTGELRYNDFSSRGDTASLFQTFNGAGAPTRRYRRDGDSAFSFGGWGATARLVHRFDDAGHEWTNELRFDRNENGFASNTLSVFTLPVSPDLYEEQLGGQYTSL